MAKVHTYTTSLNWTGNTGKGTKSYASYTRDHEVTNNEKSQTIELSSDPSFRGDPTRHNPEELLLISLSSCHMLWYLHLCSTEGVIVVAYADDPVGEMTESADGRGKFSKVTLRPSVVVQNATMVHTAKTLHQKASEMCFIANSVAFPIGHEVSVKVE